MSSAQETDGGRKIDWPRGHSRIDPADRDSYPGDLSPTRKESFQSAVVRAVVTLITWRLPTPTIKSEGDTNSAEDSGSVASLAGDLGLVALSSTKSITRGASA